jgi:hypothetical protein
MIAPVARTTLKDLADRLIEGGLEKWLRKLKVDDRESLDSIARHLQHDHQIIVTAETVRLWCKDYGIPTERPDPERAA